MTDVLRADIHGNIRSRFSRTGADGGVAFDRGSFRPENLFVLGTGLNQAERQYHTQFTIAEGASQTWSLGAGALSDELGNAINLTTICVLAVWNHDDTAGLYVSNTAGAFLKPSDVDTASIMVPPLGWIMLVAPSPAANDYPGTDITIEKENVIGTLQTGDLFVIGRE